MSSDHTRDAWTVTLTRDALRGSRRATRESPPLMRNEASDSPGEETFEIPLPTTMLDESDEITVLHVDDDPDIVELTQMFLEQTDDAFTVHGTTSSVEALKLIQERDVDCIISDYDMPNTDGLELLEIVREQHPDLPFILYTAKGSEAVASDAISAGVTDYMQKETGTEQYEVLANRVRNAVERHRAHERFWDALLWYRQLAEQDFAGVFVVQDREFTYVNDQFAEIFGYLREDLLGQSLEMVLSETANSSTVDALLDTTDGERRTCNATVTGVRRDGSEIDLELYAGSLHHGNVADGCVGLVWRSDR